MERRRPLIRASRRCAGDRSAQTFGLAAIMRFQLVAAFGLLSYAGVSPALVRGQDSATLLGEVDFQTTCARELADDLDRAVALLHSFEFEASRGVFESLGLRDQSCSVAHWGVAMTYYHLLWAPPTSADLAQGQAAAERARSLANTDRERALAEAISIFYEDHERLDHRIRARSYETAMAAVSALYPEDEDVEFLYLVATLSNLDPTDKSYSLQRRTGARLEQLLADYPRHPGALHYIIHSYDYPPLAERAVQAAYSYMEVAASASHALHMSSHVFTQEGMWDEAVLSNERAAEVARAMGARPGLAAQGQQNEVHALDYLAYAHLQMGQDEKALAVVDHLDSIDDLDWGNPIIAFNAAVVPARYVLERRAWSRAAELPLLDEAERMGTQPRGLLTVAIRHWTRALGAARAGRQDMAEAELEPLTRTATELMDHPDVWARNTSEVLRLQASAWLELARGQREVALRLMESAADLEDQTDKISLSPGRVLPAHEQLGDLLMQLDRPEEALRHYEISLEHADRRFNSYYGAAIAARAAGRTDAAIEYYERVLELAPESLRVEVGEARDFLSNR